MTTEMMNSVELNENELDAIFGSGFLYKFPVARGVYRCKNCNRRYYEGEVHKCPFEFPKMDVDNRPAITPPIFRPTSKQA